MKMLLTTMPGINMPNARTILHLTLMIGLALFSLSRLASASDPAASAHIIIELNNLEQRTGACRLSLLVENHLEQPIQELGFELVLFGKDQRIMQLLAVAAGDFPKSKSRVKQFDLKTVECAKVDRILLNNITQCTANGFTPATCLSATRTRTRTNVQLTY